MTPFEIDWSKEPVVAYLDAPLTDEAKVALESDCGVVKREGKYEADFRAREERIRHRERMSRLRRYNFSARDVMDLFTAIAKGSGDVLVPENFAFPKGAIVTNVSTPTFGRYISVTVQHDSFDVVDDACEIPLADPEPAMMRRFTIKEV